MGDFPYKYGSDLHFLWGWGERLRVWLEKDRPPSESARLIFRPDRGARAAMMRLSVAYPLVVRPVQDALDFTERQFSRFLDGEPAEDDLVHGILSLRSRIKTAAETIGKAEDDDGSVKGVSLLDATLLLSEGDEAAARETRKRWQNSRDPKLPDPIGTCPHHAQVKLYAPSAICDFAEKIEGPEECRKHRLWQKLLRLAREPRPE